MSDPRPSSASPAADDDGFAPTVLLQSSHPPASHDALPAGSLVGEYEILDVLGEGGFGIVYLARDPVLDRPVAIKEYLPVALAARSAGGRGITLRAAAHAETFTAGMKSFINEGRMLAHFDHPALVRVHRFWQENRTAYMAMPYYDGETLQARRRRMQQPPDEAWLRRLLDPILGALEVLHAENCYHRDISPDNILVLSESGLPVLLDFGAARRVVEDRTQLLTAILKPAFAPIEQYAEGSRVHQGPWTDLYALAAVVRYCMTGNAPLPATVRAVEDQMQPMADIARTISTAFPHLEYSPAFLQAIDWAMAVLPQERPRSVAQLRAALAGTATNPRARPTVALFTLPGKGPAGTPSARQLAQQLAGADPIGPTTPQDEPVDAAVRAALDAALSGFETLPHLRPGGAGAAPAAAGEAEAEDAAHGADPTQLQPSYDAPPPRRAGRLLRWGGGVAALGIVVASAGPLQRYYEAEKRAAQVSEAALRATESNPGVKPDLDGSPAAVRSSDADALASSIRQDEIDRLQGVPTAAGPVAAASATPGHVPPAAASVTTTLPSLVIPPAVSSTVHASQARAPATQVATAEPSTRGGVAGSSRQPAAPAPAARTTEDAAPVRITSPRQACGSREQFALYRCMQTQCQRKTFSQHAQCKALRERDEVLTD
jgi:serine/threonine protein kinase